MTEVGRKMVPGAKPVVLDHFDLAFTAESSPHLVRQETLRVGRNIADLFEKVCQDIDPEQDFVVLVTVCKIEVYEESVESPEL